MWAALKNQSGNLALGQMPEAMYKTPSLLPTVICQWAHTPHRQARLVLKKNQPLRMGRLFSFCSKPFQSLLNKTEPNLRTYLLAETLFLLQGVLCFMENTQARSIGCSSEVHLLCFQRVRAELGSEAPAMGQPLQQREGTGKEMVTSPRWSRK